MTDYLDLAEIVLRIIEKSSTKPSSRRSFSKTKQNATLEKQNHLCNSCGEKSDVWDFDHIDEDSSNNSVENCQALCPSCHAKKTRKIKQKKLKLSQLIKALRRFLK